MNFISVDSYDKLSAIAANIIAAQVTLKPNCVLGLATGSSPLGTYAKLAEKYNAGELDFSTVTSVNLDEYVGLDGTNEQSYRYFMDHNLFCNININKELTFVPNGCADNLKLEGMIYDEFIKSLGGIDLQLLGIGLDGHIGFNEPADEFTKGTNPVKLTESTIKANSRFFESESDVPTMAFSMGIGQIMRAKKIILLANGSAKAEILERALFGAVTPRVPASILQFAADVEVYADEDALSLIIEKHGKDAVIY